MLVHKIFTINLTKFCQSDAKRRKCFFPSNVGCSAILPNLRRGVLLSLYIYIYKHFDICKKIAFMKSCYTNIFCCYSKKKKKTYFVCVLVILWIYFFIHIFSLAPLEEILWLGHWSQYLTHMKSS